MAEIDSLQIQISVDSKQATSGVERLIRTLDKLKKVERSFASSKTAKVINDITKAVKNAPNSEKIKCISQLATALKKLPETVHFPSNLGSEIKNLNESLNNLTDKNIGKLKDLSSGLKTLSKNKGGLKSPIGAGESKFNLTNLLNMGAFINALRWGTNAISGFITKSMTYTEDLNLFTASMGKYADEAQKYGEKVSNIMGIDPAQWLRAQGIFQMIAEGFGVASDRAYIMSKNLTQLSYDISSFANISVEEAIEKLTSGISGELEPLRRIGYDLSMARLKAEALALGIHKNFNEMTQAEKSQLRYMAIMKQVTVAQGDMARTLEAPANQMRILSAMTVQAGRAIGNIFIPMLNAILPYAIAALNGIKALANGIASLFGFKLPKIDYSGITKGSSALGGLADKAKKAGSGLKGASDEAKKLKNNLLGIDELNIISQETPKAGGGGGGGAADVGDLGAFDFELPEYDFLKGLTDGKISKAMKELTEWGKKLAPVMVVLGAALAAIKWMNFVKALGDLKNLIPGLDMAGWLSSFAGALLFFGGAIVFANGAVDAVMNGMNWVNLAKMLGGMAGMIVGAYVALMKLNPYLAPIAAGFTAAATGLTLFWISMRDANTHGANLTNVLGGAAGLVALVGGLVFACKDLVWVIGGINIAPFIAPLVGFVTSLEMIKTGIVDIHKNGANLDNTLMVLCGGVIAVTTAVMALNAAMAVNPLFAVAMGLALVIGGVASSVYDVNNRLQEIGESTYKASDDFKTMEQSIKDSQKAMDEARDSCKALGDKMDALNEVQVNNATVQSLVDDIMTLNDKAELTAENISEIKWKADMLKDITNGKVNLEFDETTGHIKQTREEVENLIESYKKEAEQKALQEVMTEAYEDKFRAIQNIKNEQKKFNEELGKVKDLTDELNGINKYLDPVRYGEVNAKLESHTKALETSRDALKENVQLFQDSSDAIETVGDTLTNVLTNGTEEYDKYKEVIESTDFDVSTIVAQMEENGKNVSDGFEKGLRDSFLDISFIQIFGPLGKVFKDIFGIHSPSKVFMEYGEFISKGLEIGISNGIAGVITAITGLGGNISSKFTELVNAEKFKKFADDTITGFKSQIESTYTNVSGSITQWAKSVKDWFTTGENGVNKENFGKHGSNIIDGFKDKVGADYIHSKQKLIDWAKGVKDWFVKDGGASKQTFEGFAKDVVDGFKDKVESLKSTVKGKMTALADYVKTNFSHPNGKSLKSMFEDIGHDVMEGFKSGLEKAKEFVGGAVNRVTSFITRRSKKNLEVNSPSKVFKRIGSSVTEGLALGIESTTPEVLDSIDSMTAEMVKTHPKLEYQVDTSKVKFSDNSSLMGVATGSVTKQTDVAVSGFKEGMIEFYREYMEPTMREMAVDMKRQADKKEETVVQIGNRTVHDAVIEQREANGYSFISER